MRSAPVGLLLKLKTMTTTIILLAIIFAFSFWTFTLFAKKETLEEELREATEEIDNSFWDYIEISVSLGMQEELIDELNEKVEMKSNTIKIQSEQIEQLQELLKPKQND